MFHVELVKSWDLCGNVSLFLVPQMPYLFQFSLRIFFFLISSTDFVSADPQLPAKCLKHTFTVHTKYELAPPYPAFNPRSFLKLDGVAILNTGYSLVALNVELEGEDNKYTAGKKEFMKC